MNKKYLQSICKQNTACYESFENIDNLSVSKRVERFKSTVIEMLKNGTTTKNITDTVELFIDCEQYEAAEGVKLAVKEFNSNYP